MIVSATVFAQTTVSVSGNFTNNGTPRPFQLIHLVYSSNDSLNPVLITDSVLTDSSGFYSSTKTMPSNVTDGYVAASTNDCANSFQTKVYFFTTITKTFTANFICPAPSCYNSFKYGTNPISSNNLYIEFTQSYNYGPNTYYTWDFGDGTVGTGVNPSHTYPQAGVYSVCLTTTNTLTNCTDTYCDSIFVAMSSPSCFANFYSFPDSNLYKINFFSNVSVSPSAYLFWDFGDNTTGYGMYPSHTYSTDGIYNVCLSVIDSANACNSTFCSLVQAGTVLFTPCNADFKMFIQPDSSLIGGSNVLLSSASAAWPTNISWDFGDGTYGVGSPVLHHYSSPGTYTICAYVSDTSFLCADTVCKTVQMLGGNVKILGLENGKSVEIVKFFPNPVSDMLNINLNSIEDQNVTLEIVDFTGKTMYSLSQELTTGDTKIELNTESLINGIYLLKIQTKEGVISRKIVKN